MSSIIPLKRRLSFIQILTKILKNRTILNSVQFVTNTVLYNLGLKKCLNKRSMLVCLTYMYNFFYLRKYWVRNGYEKYEGKEYLGECDQFPIDMNRIPSKINISLAATYAIINDEINVSPNVTFLLNLDIVSVKFARNVALNVLIMYCVCSRELRKSGMSGHP